jgi:hypothetical protein
MPHINMEPIEPIASESLFTIAVEAELLVHSFVDELIERGANVLYDRYLEGKCVPSATAQLTAMLVNATELLHLRRDIGEAHLWPEADEPQPCAIDTWGRSAVQVKKKYTIMPRPALVSPRGEGSLRSHMTTLTRVSQAFRSKQTKPAEALVEERHFTPVPLPQQKVNSTTEEDTLRQQKDAENLRKIEAETRKRQEQETEQERAKDVAKRLQELKDKEYTYDYDGRIITVKTQTDARQFDGPEFKLAEDEPPKAGNKRRIQKVVSPKELPTVKSKKPPVGDLEFVKNIQSGQPQLFTNINLSAGVTIGEGTKSRQSPKRPKLKTLTRSQYHKLTETNSLHNTHSSFTSSIKSSRKEPKERDEFGRTQVVTSRRDLLSEIPDNEEDEADELMHRPLHGKSQSTRLFSAITRFGEGAQESEGVSEIDQFNFELLKNKQWGANPPIKNPLIPSKLPQRPSQKTLRETHGSRAQLPRERPATTSHSRLPPVGQTKRHGQLRSELKRGL